jgi:hypothetical protein
MNSTSQGFKSVSPLKIVEPGRLELESQVSLDGVVTSVNSKKWALDEKYCLLGNNSRSVLKYILRMRRNEFTGERSVGMEEVSTPGR